MINALSSTGFEGNQFDIISNVSISDKQYSNKSIINPSASREDYFLYVAIPTASTTEFRSIKRLNSLITKKLKKEISISIENDDDGFIAKTLDLPLFGFGNYPNEAIENLKYEIESCYGDLLIDNDFSREWLNYKRYLMEIIE